MMNYQYYLLIYSDEYPHLACYHSHNILYTSAFSLWLFIVNLLKTLYLIHGSRMCSFHWPCLKEILYQLNLPKSSLKCHFCLFCRTRVTCLCAIIYRLNSHLPSKKIHFNKHHLSTWPCPNSQVDKSGKHLNIPNSAVTQGLFNTGDPLGIKLTEHLEQKFS